MNELLTWGGDILDVKGDIVFDVVKGDIVFDVVKGDIVFDVVKGDIVFDVVKYDVYGKLQDEISF